MAEQNFLDIIRRCNRCGFCQDVCPTYYYTKKETMVARGRIRLLRILEESLDDWSNDRELTDILQSCLLCKACMTNCPSSVPMDQLMYQAREKINQANGLSFTNKTLYRGVLSKRERLPRLMALARLYNGSGVRRLVRKLHLMNINKKMNQLESHLPLQLKKSARSQLSHWLKKIDQPRYRIVYFLGCATDNFFSDIARATILYLQHMGCEVIVPPVSCCGGPHRSAGDLDEARRLARNNISYFLETDSDFIVSDCATCTATIKEYGQIFDNVRERAAAESFSDKILDLNQFIVRYLPLPELKPLVGTVTYHDPCHLVRGLGVTAEPRSILRTIPGITYVEMPRADWCCGGAGSYFLARPKMSDRILTGKMEDLEKTGAQILATSCPACAMQLSAGILQQGYQVTVKHPVQLLAAAAGLI